MVELSVIVVSYNTRDLLRRCLLSLDEAAQVIVVDNASQDGSADMVAAEFPRVTLIRNATNRGFGAANNQGLRIARHERALLLNSDAAARPDALRRIAEALDGPNVIAAGGSLISPDGSLQPSTANRLTLWAVTCEQFWLEKLFPHSRLLAPYWTTNRLPRDQVSDVGQVMGACLAMKRGLEFDERFFLYCEDTELCRRLADRGRIVYEPRAEFDHELGASSAGADRWKSIARYNRGKELYFRIHHGASAAFACWVLNRLGALVRLLIWLLIGPFKALRGGWPPQPRWFAKVLVAPIQGP